MPDWKPEIRARLAGLNLEATRELEIVEEISQHLDDRFAELCAGGASEDEVRRLALEELSKGGLLERELGRVERPAGRETPVLGESKGNLLENIYQDLRYGLRMLRKNPGFTAVAVLTLALGIGANTAIFSVIDHILLRPLPYHDPDRLALVSQSNFKRGYAQIIITPEELRLWQEQNSVFEELGGEIYDSRTLTGIERPEHIHCALTTPNFFSVFGVPPILGRTFVADDKPPGGVRVAVLSHGLWQRDFGGDRGVIGRSITLSGLNYTVVGVMPGDFKIFNPPTVFGLPTGDVQPQLWIPYPQPLTERTNHFFLGFGRLKPGVTFAQAQAELSEIAGRLATEAPSQKNFGASVQPIKEAVVGGARPALNLLWIAVGFVLLIACANVANLSLARAAARGNEFAVRAALGAARPRLVRQLLVESAILAFAGGGLGALLGWASVAGIKAFPPAKFPRIDEIQLDGPVLCFTLLVSLVTALVFGLAPALRASKPDFNASLKDSARGTSEGHDRRRTRGALVVAEVALAMVLLAGAGLMIGSFARLARVSPGFAPEQLMTFDFTPTMADYTDDSKRIRMHKELCNAVQGRPGVKSAATVYGLPFGTMLNSLCGAVIEGRSGPEGGPERASAAWRVASPGYFETMGVPIRTGRPFSEELDKSNSLPVVIVNEAFARKYFSGENPVGRRIQIFTLGTNWSEIVGVAQDVKLTGLDAQTMPEMYQPDSQQAAWMFSLVVRSSLHLREVEGLVRSVVASVDKDLIPYNIRSMEGAISSSVAGERFTTILIGLFAALALTLAGVGIYGVISYSVSRQTREIGIRMALGASRGSVLSLVLRQGMVLVLAGVVIGLAGSFGLTRLIASQLFEISPADPVTFATVAALLILVALTACYLPARRATRVDPMVALRCE